MRSPWSLILCCVILGVVASLGAHAQETTTPSSEEEISGALERKEHELEELGEKIRALRDARAKKQQEAGRITTAIEVLEDGIQEAQLQLDLTTVTMEQVRLNIRENLAAIEKLDARLQEQRRELLDVVRQLNRDDQQPLAQLFLSGGTFSDILRLREATRTLHDRMIGLLLATRDARTARERRQEEFTERREELLDLQKLQQAQRASLQTEERRKEQLLSQNIAQQHRVAAEMTEAEEARKEIQQAIFTLRNAGLRLSLKEAEDFARYAGKLTGVRPALLLGVLKVESNIGTNVGSGRYPDDMHPAHREAFLRVAEKLGLDPTTTPVSAKPRSYPGWGGALGPGQIMPGTWERVEETVARLTGKPKPSPFDLGDAFVATAVILGGAGAANGNEYEAVNRYFAGPNWQRFTWYGDRVLAVAREYAQRGL